MVKLTCLSASLAVLALYAPARAQDAGTLREDLAACRVIDSSSARLDCFDRVASTVSLDASPMAAVRVVLLSKQYAEVDYQDYIIFDLLVSNLLPKDVRALTGVLKFNDLFDREIMSFELTVEEPIASNGIRTWAIRIEYDQFMDEHVRLRTIETENLKVVFELREVLYSDGTRERFGGDA